jgi:putative acetyltransferase
MTSVRIATNLDRDSIREMYLRAFPDAEAQTVANLAVELLAEVTKPDTISLVAEVGDAVVGHVGLSPMTAANDVDWTGYILAPLGVAPDFQQRRIGSQLVETGIERLSNSGVNVLFVYGDPDYYGRFGFTRDAATGYLPPYALQHPDGWQALVLDDKASAESRLALSCAAPLRDPALW